MEVGGKVPLVLFFVGGNDRNRLVWANFGPIVPFFRLFFWRVLRGICVFLGSDLSFLLGLIFEIVYKCVRACVRRSETPTSQKGATLKSKGKNTK